MAEEQKWQEPEGYRLCANNCGFFGSPTTLHLCSKCYRDHCLKEQQASAAKLAVEISLASVHSSASDLAISPEIQVESSSVPEEAEAIEQTEVLASVESNRCAVCRRRVGLTGFNCRCGTTFCGTHRYPEQHGCMFDFKAMGKEEISKANPVVKADKLDKI